MRVTNNLLITWDGDNQFRLDLNNQPYNGETLAAEDKARVLNCIDQVLSILDGYLPKKTKLRIVE